MKTSTYLYLLVSYENDIFIVVNVLKWKYNAFQFRKGDVTAQSKSSPQCQVAQTGGIHQSQAAPQVIIFLISNNKIAFIVFTRLIFLRTFSS